MMMYIGYRIQQQWTWREGGREDRQKRRRKGREDNHFRSHGDDDDVSLSDYLITLDSTPGAVVLLELGGGMEAGPPR